MQSSFVKSKGSHQINHSQLISPVDVVKLQQQQFYPCQHPLQKQKLLSALFATIAIQEINLTIDTRQKKNNPSVQKFKILLTQYIITARQQMNKIILKKINKSICSR
jgi:hypothetical protein